jgi:hypothetical protein
MPITYDDRPGGMACYGTLSPDDQVLLRRALDAGRSALAAAWAASAAKREIFWINLWQSSGESPAVALACAAELDASVRRLAAAIYADQPATLDGYGFIVNPIGSKTQPWHVDYTMDCSSVFIPLTRLTPQNSTQYLVLPAPVPEAARRAIAADLDVIDLGAVADACAFVSVRQLLAPPFSLLRLDFGAIHRGVANTGDFERILFYFSVNRGAVPVAGEPVFEAIHPDKLGAP